MPTLMNELINQLLPADLPTSHYEFYPQWKATISTFENDNSLEFFEEEEIEPLFTKKEPYLGFFGYSVTCQKLRQHYLEIEYEALIINQSFLRAELLTYINTSFMFSVPARVVAYMGLDLYLTPLPFFPKLKQLRGRPLNIHLWENPHTWNQITNLSWYESGNHIVEQGNQNAYLYYMTKLVLDTTGMYLNSPSDQLDSDVLHTVGLWFTNDVGLSPDVYDEWVKYNFAVFALYFDEEFFTPMGKFWIASYYVFKHGNQMNEEQIQLCVEALNEKHSTSLENVPLSQLLSIFYTIYDLDKDDSVHIRSVPVSPYGEEVTND